MTEQTNLLPKRRFKEFQNSGLWEQQTFSAIVTRVSTTGEENILPRVEYEDVVSGFGKLNKNIFLKESQKKGIEFEPGDVLYGKLRPYLQNWLLADFKGIAVGDWWVLRPNGIKSSFIYSLIQSNKYQTVANLSAGTKMPRSDWNIVGGTDFMVPTASFEQTKIGDFFETLDHLITLQQRKLEKTKALKAAYLSEMFPAEGAHVPERRFKEFEGTWKQRKLNEISVVNTGYPFDSKNFNKLGKYLVITNGNIQNGSTFVDDSLGNRIDIQNETLLAKYILHPDEILVTMDGNVGRSAKVINNNQILAQRVCRLIAKEDKEFLYQLLNTGRFSQSMKKASHGGTIKHISLNEIGEYTFLAPPSIEEQEKIGIFLKNIDKIIFLCMYKLEKLQHLKKAYLHEMFV